MVFTKYMKTISREMKKSLNKRQESNIQFIIHALLAMKFSEVFPTQLQMLPTQLDLIFYK